MLKFRRKVAFTLIELLMIIIIIAVVSALVVPAYARYWSKAKFESSVHQIEEMLSDARDKAVELDTTTTVSFNKQSQTFMVMTFRDGLATVTLLAYRSGCPGLCCFGQPLNGEDARWQAGSPL